MRNANGVRCAAIDARVVADILCRAGSVKWTILVGDALYADTSLLLLVRVSDKEAHQWTSTLGDSVFHNAEGILAALVVPTSIDAVANAVFVGQTQLTGQRAVVVGV